MVVGGRRREEILESVEIGIGEEIGERRGGARFDVDGAGVVAVDGGGGVAEAAGEREEASEGLGERGLEEMRSGGESGESDGGREEEDDVAMDVRGELVIGQEERV